MHNEHPTFNRRDRGSGPLSPRSRRSPCPRAPSAPRTMAKEGVEKAEETEQMIEKETGKEPAEGGGGSHRLGDTQEMRAVVLAGFGGLNKLRVSRKAMPEPQDGELKIRVKAWSSIRAFLAFSLCALGAPGRRWRSLVGPGPGAPAAGAPLGALTPVSEPLCGPPLMLGRMLRWPFSSPSQIQG